MSLKRFRIGILLVSVFSAISVCAQQTDDEGYADRDYHRRQDAALLQQRKLNEVYNYLRNMYVDEADMAPLVERAIESMLEELDPHSSYISVKEMKSVKERFDGEFSGIGIEFNVHRDTIMVMNVIAGAPAESVGIRPNDRIVTIDGENAVGMKRADVPSKLRGKSGTSVNVGIKRHGSDGITEYNVVRGKIPLNTVDAAYRVKDTVGYVKVNRFGHTTINELERAVGSLSGINSLLLDLRGNGGGVLGQAIEVANFFLAAESLILSTEGRGVKTQYARAKHDGPFSEGNVVVLIDESSASASEIVAGALQDWDRGVVVGTPSFGKGLVQRQVILPDSSAVLVTIARYHTPTGRVIQRPYENGKREEYFQAHRERLYNRDADTLATEDLPRYKTLRNGRTVYGGGGITPDIIVEQDTTLVTPYIAKLTATGVIVDFLYDYLDRERDELSGRFDSFDRFDNEYAVTDDVVDELFAAGENRGIFADDMDRERSRRFIDRYIKAFVAHMLFSNTEYYRVLNTYGDRVYDAAVDLILDPKRMASILSAEAE